MEASMLGVLMGKLPMAVFHASTLEALPLF